MEVLPTSHLLTSLPPRADADAMKVIAPLVLTLLAVVSAQPFQEGLAGRPAKRGHQAQLEKNDVYADRQAWKRTGDWHDVSPPFTGLC